MRKLSLFYVLFLLILPACGKKNVDADGTIGSSISIGITSPGTSSITNLSQWCSQYSGSMISLNGVQVCKLTIASLPSFYYAFLGSGYMSTGFLIYPGDTLKIGSSSGSNASARINGVAFSVSSGHVSLRNEQGYLELGASGTGTVSMSGIKIERCVDANNAAYQCP